MCIIQSAWHIILILDIREELKKENHGLMFICYGINLLVCSSRDSFNVCLGSSQRLRSLGLEFSKESEDSRCPALAKASV